MPAGHTERVVVFALAVLLMFTWAAESRSETDVPGRSGQGLNASQSPASCAASPAYNARPLTVECWARLNSAKSYNILVANETKASQTHWEMFTLPRSGFLAAYLPGHKPPQVESRCPIADGQWHHVAMVLDGEPRSKSNQGHPGVPGRPDLERGERLQLYVDTKKVADARIARPPYLKTVPGALSIGALVEGGLGCDGVIDEVRISNVARAFPEIPAQAFQLSANTLGLWHFDKAEVGPDKRMRFADSSPAGNYAVVKPAPRDVTTLSSAEAAELEKGKGRPAGQPIAIQPPQVNLAATRESLQKALSALNLKSLAHAAQTRDAVLADWEEQYNLVDLQLRGKQPLPRGAVEQVLDKHALVFESDGDPLGVILRRTEALVQRLKQMSPSPDLCQLAEDFVALKAACQKISVQQVAARKDYFLAGCALQRQVAFANPLLNFDTILFVARGNYLGSRVTGSRSTHDVWGQHFATQYFAFNSIPGGGVFAVKNFKTRPEVVNILKGAVVEKGRLKGRRLEPGAFLSPDLSYDGKTILFAYTENKEHKWVWSNQTTWNIFKVNTDGSNLVQLTDSPYDDFDPCWLPNGRVAFISERRGGFIRCFANLHVPSYVLHSMKADGSDIYPLSFYETSEWHPSVNNDGMIVYTRWDYTDRENCLGSNFWICYPDGRDPRAPHGNYPYPWHTFQDNTHADSRRGRPYVEMNIRAIPNSHRYILTAAPHHGEAFGSLAMLDLHVKDDGFMSQLRRITPYAPFPETELPGRSQYPYGTPWPLSEDFYLCNWWENLYLLDRFGNQVLICENALAFDGKTNYDMRLIDPIPLRPRPTPPVIPTQTHQGEDADPAHPTAKISIMNVYESDLPFPKGTRIKWLRVTQNILKLNPWMGRPMIGYQNENTPRIPLGIVPVEEDGSVHFEAPVERELIFQVLDENYMAVQSMRSVAYVHPGEHLSCIGCHEDKQKAPGITHVPMALRREPSKLQPEVAPFGAITYYRLVKPVFERSCIPCHKEKAKEPLDMDYAKLEPYVFYFAGGMSWTTIKPIHGGSRTIPGRFGARNSRMGKALLDKEHKGKISEQDYRRVVLWLDSNSPRLGAYHDEEKQMRGELVWPPLDTDPSNPQGLEKRGQEPF